MPRTSAAALRVSGTPASAKPRIMVVDDEEPIREAIARYLRVRGFDAVTEDSAETALARLGREHVDIMLCDVRMPVMSGLEALPHALRLNRDLAVLMLTGVNDASTATDAISQGAMDYLVKPVPLAKLEQALERAAHRRNLQIERRNADSGIREVTFIDDVHGIT